MFYFFYQTKPEGAWQIALASEREKITSELKPVFVTVLDVDNDFQSEMDWATASKVKYLGPAYFDFDSDSIAEVIPKFKEFLELLQRKGVDLNTLRLFASGGKGFHVEMPLATLKDKVPKSGIAGLPYILKELAHELAIDTMDFRVYTAKKGRMWRTPNVQRPNGKYKVPITVSEALNMTPELYDELCSAPRSAPPVEPAKFVPNLAVLFSMAEGQFANRQPCRAANARAKKLLGGRVPPSIDALMQGRLQSSNGWNRIALQLAILAHEIGMDEDALAQRCAGLIQTHQSDGTRYSSPRERERELRRQWHYQQGSNYAFSIGGLRSILPKGLRYPDLNLLGRALS